MSVRLFTDKLVFGRLEVLGVCSLDSATPVTSAYPAHASGSPHGTADLRVGQRVGLFAWKREDMSSRNAD
jgi:hypothetical protein